VGTDGNEYTDADGAVRVRRRPHPPVPTGATGQWLTTRHPGGPALLPRRRVGEYKTADGRDGSPDRPVRVRGVRRDRRGGKPAEQRQRLPVHRRAVGPEHGVLLPARAVHESGEREVYAAGRI